MIHCKDCKHWVVKEEDLGRVESARATFGFKIKVCDLSRMENGRPVAKQKRMFPWSRENDTEELLTAGNFGCVLGEIDSRATERDIEDTQSLTEYTQKNEETSRQIAEWHKEKPLSMSYQDERRLIARESE